MLLVLSLSLVAVILQLPTYTTAITVNGSDACAASGLCSATSGKLKPFVGDISTSERCATAHYRWILPSSSSTLLVHGTCARAA